MRLNPKTPMGILTTIEPPKGIRHLGRRHLVHDDLHVELDHVLVGLVAHIDEPENALHAHVVPLDRLHQHHDLLNLQARVPEDQVLDRVGLGSPTRRRPRLLLQHRRHGLEVQRVVIVPIERHDKRVLPGAVDAEVLHDRSARLVPHRCYVRDTILNYRILIQKNPFY